MASPCNIGIISDTHGLMRPEALELLRGSDLILHAGDIGDGHRGLRGDGAPVLEGLRRLAPLVAVRGNNDTGPWAAGLSETEVVDAGGYAIYLIHDLRTLDLDPPGGGFHCVVSGHSHRPAAEEREGVLYVNPGSAGPRRFRLPVTVARLRVEGGRARAEILPVPGT